MGELQMSVILNVAAADSVDFDAGDLQDLVEDNPVFQGVKRATNQLALAVQFTFETEPPNRAEIEEAVTRLIRSEGFLLGDTPMTFEWKDQA